MSSSALQTSAYLHHLHLHSPGPERLATFYGAALDMDVKLLDRGLWLATGPARRALFSAGEAGKLASASFAVREACSLQGLLERAEETNLAPRIVQAHLLQRGAFVVNDPDGNEIQFGLTAPAAQAARRGLRGRRASNASRLSL